MSDGLLLDLDYRYLRNFTEGRRAIDTIKKITQERNEARAAADKDCLSLAGQLATAQAEVIRLTADRAALVDQLKAKSRLLERILEFWWTKGLGKEARSIFAAINSELSNHPAPTHAALMAQVAGLETDAQGFAPVTTQSDALEAQVAELTRERDEARAEFVNEKRWAGLEKDRADVAEAHERELRALQLEHESEVAELTRERAALMAQLEEMRQKRNTARDHAVTAESSNDALVAQVAELTRERDEARFTLVSAKKHAELADAEVTRLTEALAAAEEMVDRVRQLTEALAAAERVSDTAVSGNALATRRARDAEARVRELTEALAVESESLRCARVALQQTALRAEAAEAQVAELTRELDEARAESCASCIKAQRRAESEVTRLTEALTAAKLHAGRQAGARAAAEARVRQLEASHRFLCNICNYTHSANEPHGRRRDVD